MTDLLPAAPGAQFLEAARFGALREGAGAESCQDAGSVEIRRIDVTFVVDEDVRRADPVEIFGDAQDVPLRAAIKEDLGAGLQAAVFRVMRSFGMVEDDIEIGVPGLRRQFVAEMDVGPCNRVKTQDGAGFRLLRAVVVARRS